jgi:hypothetical protein
MATAEPHWTEPLELIVRKSAEHALALSWAHEAAQRWCASWNTRLMFPSIILSSLIGVGSVGSSQILPFDGANTAVGIASITVGILQTIQNYFAFAKRSESHRITSLQYSKLHAFLSLQLSLPRKERKKATEVIDTVRDLQDKLSDVAPLIPIAVKEVFHKRFGSLDDYSIPFILNGLERVSITTQDSLDTPRTTVRIVS